jgi:hypothetical protein
MHQALKVQPSAHARFASAIACAGTLATGLVILMSGGCFPLCALYSPDDPLWLVFACFTCGL